MRSNVSIVRQSNICMVTVYGAYAKNVLVALDSIFVPPDAAIELDGACLLGREDVVTHAQVHRDCAWTAW